MGQIERLPLGIDIGTTRVRVAYAERHRTGGVALMAMATRELTECAAAPEAAEPELLASVLEELCRETGARVRSCVTALPASAGTLHVLRFPKMSWPERRRAAAFEAERFAPWDAKTVASLVRVHPVDRSAGLYAVGIARRRDVAARIDVLRRAGLRPRRIDTAACAMRRALPMADAIVDIGFRESTLSAGSAGGGIASLSISGGGSEITSAIADELRIEPAVAEKRKRILGTAGAGEQARNRFVRAVTDAIAEVRRSLPVRRVALIGNGARLPGLPAEIESATGAIVEVPVCDLLRDGAYPEDVVRAAAPDWTLAASLATWEAATP